MRVIITAVGHDNRGLADPIVHYVASVGAHIAEIQMYDRDDGGVFALLVRLKWPGTAATLADLRAKQHMLTFGATAHFVVPELDVGGQIIQQETFTVAPGTSLKEVMRVCQTEHEPRCLVEGLRRVLDREVELQFHKVVPVARRPEEWRRDGAGAAPFVHRPRESVAATLSTLTPKEPVTVP
jgi:formyltetrahydrofolate hydrolase